MYQVPGMCSYYCIHSPSYYREKTQHFHVLETVCHISNAAPHVIAGAIRSGLEVQSADGVNISIIFTVELLSITIVGPHLPQLMHLSHYHRRDIIIFIIVIIIYNNLSQNTVRYHLDCCDCIVCCITSSVMKY